MTASEFFKYYRKLLVTVVLTPGEARELLDAIDIEWVVGLRDRALIALMVIPERENVSGFSVEHPRVPKLPKSRGFAISGLLFWLSCRELLREYLAHNKIDRSRPSTTRP